MFRSLPFFVAVMLLVACQPVGQPVAVNSTIQAAVNATLAAQPSPSPAPTNSPAHTATIAVAAAITPTLAPTNPPPASPTPLPSTFTPTATSTPTSAPSPTPTSTVTPLPPTFTPIPPTFTPVPPTFTPIPPTFTPVPPTSTPPPLPASAEIGVAKSAGPWGLKLYDVKRAKAVWFAGQGTYAQGVWLIPFVEFTNNGSGTRSPNEDLDFYFVDDQGRSFDFSVLSSKAILGAANQFTTGHYYDPINPGLVLGISLPFDTPLDLGGVWLKIQQDPAFSIYLGQANQVPLVDQ